MSDVPRHTLHERRTPGGDPPETPDMARLYWAVIPAYNEASTVREVATKAREQLANVIVVDDGSTDGTALMLSGLDVTVLRNKSNCGKAGSLRHGFEYALDQGAVGVVTLDADGQHLPEEIPRFLHHAIRAPNVLLVGARGSEQRQRLFWRYLANRVADFWISWAAGRWIEDSQSGFRVYPAAVLRDVQLKHDRARSFVFESEVLIESARRGFDCRTVPVTAKPRSGPSSSHFRPLLDIARITKMVASRLLARGLYLQGLVRAVREFRSKRRAEGKESDATSEASKKPS